MPGDSAPLQDRQSFENLYSHVHLVVFHYIYGLYGGPVEEVEDLTADTFFRAWKARERFTGDENAALGWLLQIARNRVIDALRREHVRRNQASLEQEQGDLELPLLQRQRVQPIPDHDLLERGTAMSDGVYRVLKRET